jgi:hypothetical protein
MDGRYNRASYNTPYSANYAYNSEDEDEFERPYYEQRRAGQQPLEARTQGNEKAKEKESMSSFLSRVSTSSQAQFAATALVSGAVVAGAIFGYQAVRRQERVKDLKSGIPEVGSSDKVCFVLWS